MGVRRSQAVTVIAAVASLAIVHAALAVSPGGPVDGARGSVPDHPGAGWAGLLFATIASLGLVSTAALKLWAIVHVVDRAAARDATGHGPSFGHLLPYAARVVGAWRSLFVAVVALFAIVEGAEAVSAGATIDGLVGSLATSLWVTVPSIAFVTLLVAATMALTGWCRCALLRRLSRRALRPRSVGRTPSSALDPEGVLLLPSLLVGAPRGRSPPMGFAVVA